MARTTEARFPQRSGGSPGFSLLEVLIALILMVGVIIVAFRILDVNTDLTRVQTQVTEVQQSIRIAQDEMLRLIRMAGRGGLPAVLPVGAAVGPVSQGAAVSVRDNVGLQGDSTDLAIGFEGSPTVVPGSDVLTVRGVFTAPVYQINAADPTSFTLTDAGGTNVQDPSVAVAGSLVLTNPGPAGIGQDLEPLADAIADGVPEALLLVSPLDDSVQAVVELNPAQSVVDDAANPTRVTVAFNAVNGTYTAAYRTLFATGGGNLPAALTNVAFAGILEEYRFYVRDVRADPTDPQSELLPRLSRARMFPGTEVPYQGLVSEAQLDIAEGILNLQVALGFDSNLGAALADRDGDGLVTQNDRVITESADGANDDWLFNSPADDPTASPWSGPWDAATPQPQLFYVRLTTLARTSGRDPKFQAPIVQQLENATFTSSPGDPLNAPLERMFRRRLLRTVVDLRNI